MDKTRLARIGAVCFSVLLGGGFVAYRQKQATPSGEPALMPSSKNPASRGLFPPDGWDNRDFVLPGSKSLSPGNIDAILNNRKVDPFADDPAADEPAAAPPPETFPPGSRSIFAIPPGDEVQSMDSVLRELRATRTFLPSSKVGRILTPKDLPKETEDPPILLKRPEEKQ